MSQKARYTVQTSAYERLLIGNPLSNRRINELAEQGFYGKEAQEKRLEERKKKQKRPKSNLLEGWT